MTMRRTLASTTTATNVMTCCRRADDIHTRTGTSAGGDRAEETCQRRRTTRASAVLSRSARSALVVAVLVVTMFASHAPMASAQFDGGNIEPPDIPTAPPIPELFFPSNSPVNQPTRPPTPKPTIVDRQETPGPVPAITLTPPPAPAPTPGPTRQPTARPTNAPTPGPTNRPTLAPTRFPTRQPTARPTNAPTPAPSPGPTNRPTLAPTRAPTPLPTERPVTFAPVTTPTFQPTLRPTPLPTLAPSPGPSPLPTFQPTPAPTNRATVGPTSAPTPSPTVNPTLVPTASPTVLASVGPSVAPTPETHAPTVSPEPTPLPSQFPSNAPSDTPSEIPSVTPSVPPTDVPSSIPSQSPTLSVQSDLVDVVMVLTSTIGLLERGSIIDWEAATAAHIRQHILETDFGDEPIFDLGVRTNIIRQVPLFGSGPVPTTQPSQAPSVVPSDAPSMAPSSALRRGRGRDLQTESALLPLRIVFDVAVSFRSLGQDYSAVTMVGEAFNSDEDRASYISRLERTNNVAFKNLSDVDLLVEGAAPLEEPPPSGGTSSNLGVIVGAAAAGALVVLVGIILVMRRRGGGGGTKEAPNTASMTDVRMGFSSEINVSRQDDISTLGDPMYGPGGIMAMGGMARDERTASVGDDYDYAKNYLNTPAGGPPSSQETRSRMASTDSGRGSSKVSLGPMANAVFSDEESFEQQYSTAEDRFEVTVPPGKLGMVIDTPNGGVPVVHAIKSESILSNRVKVGDRLVAVDEEDVTAMTAVQVSKLISLKSDQERVLSFVRAHAPDSSVAHQ